MRIRLLCIIREMLTDYIELLNDCGVEPSDKWSLYFTNSEILEILSRSVPIEDLETLSINTPNTKHLLRLVQNRTDIVEYVLQKIDEYLPPNETNIDNSFVEQLLRQMQSETSYLNFKDTKDYDKYDFSNLNNLMYKAGWLKELYGIYDEDVLELDATEVTTIPKVFYDNIHEARYFFNEIQNEQSENSLNTKILSFKFITKPINNYERFINL